VGQPNHIHARQLGNQFALLLLQGALLSFKIIKHLEDATDFAHDIVLKFAAFDELN
jgi:hypothetical protein